MLRNPPIREGGQRRAPLCALNHQEHVIMLAYIVDVYVDVLAAPALNGIVKDILENAHQWNHLSTALSTLFFYT